MEPCVLAHSGQCNNGKEPSYGWSSPWVGTKTVYTADQPNNETLRDFKTIHTLKEHIDSVTMVVLQNKSALDLQIFQKGVICLLLEEECCYYANN